MELTIVQSGRAKSGARVNSSRQPDMEMSTVAQTVIAGVLVFIAGQLFLKLVIEPIHQLKKTMADISHTFVRYAHAIHNADIIPPELHSEVFEKLRQLSGQLYADMALIPLYPAFGALFFFPRREKVYESAQHLIAVANWMHSRNDRKFDHIVRNIQNACDKLSLYTLTLHKFRLAEDLRRLAVRRGNATTPFGPPDWRTY